jgi:hypothetical protein
MGLLDDAIREHLELKRSRGADSHEVERQEQEALGPPVHGEFAQSPRDPEAAGLAAPALPAEHELPPEAVAPAEPVQAAEPAPEPRGDLEGWLDEPDEPDEPAAGQATTEYTPPDVELPHEPPPTEEPPRAEEPPTEEPPPGEDVLEETPEFLQETPEHERLWFEQKPPRDFDLDR